MTNTITIILVMKTKYMFLCLTLLSIMIHAQYDFYKVTSFGKKLIRNKIIITV